MEHKIAGMWNEKQIRVQESRQRLLHRQSTWNNDKKRVGSGKCTNPISWKGKGIKGKERNITLWQSEQEWEAITKSLRYGTIAHPQ